MRRSEVCGDRYRQPQRPQARGATPSSPSSCHAGKRVAATRSLLLIFPGCLIAWAVAPGIDGNDSAGKERKYQQEQARIDLVPVAAILVASLRLHFLDLLLHGRYSGPAEIPCHAPLTKGAEVGYFQHGSTIIVFAPKGFQLCPGISQDTRIRMGQGLMFPNPGFPLVTRGYSWVSPPGTYLTNSNWKWS